MARLHTRKRGASKSKKPYSKTAPAWIRQSKAEIGTLVEKLAREGRTPAEIGQILRDQHGIPSVKPITGKSLTALLKEKGVLGAYPSDLMSLIRRAVRMNKHIAKNKKDKSNRQKVSQVESKIKRLAKYYRGRKLPADWKYDSEKAELLVK